MSLLALAAAASVYAGTAWVRDGDTLEIEGQGVRLWGIDAPERREACRTRDGTPWRCGQAAAQALSDHLSGRTVVCEKHGGTSFARVNARCSLDGEDLGGWLVANGWAYDEPKFSKGAYAAEEQRARRRRLGLWR